MPLPPRSDTRIGWLREAVFAHRGRHEAGQGGAGQGGVPENTLAAFTAALAAGIGIECDVQLTADGQAAVFHDAALERLTAETGPIAARTAAQLAHIKLTGSNETIPLLPDLLKLVAGRAPLLIELKIPPGHSATPLAQAVAAALNHDLGTVAVMSFTPQVPRWFAHNMPNLPRGLIIRNSDWPGPLGPWRRARAIARARPDFLAVHIADLPAAFAARWRARGRPLATWTVRDAEQLARAHAHADALIAEDPALALALTTAEAA